MSDGPEFQTARMIMFKNVKSGWQIDFATNTAQTVKQKKIIKKYARISIIDRGLILLNTTPR
jgi:hypothetical protein